MADETNQSATTATAPVVAAVKEHIRANYSLLGVHEDLILGAVAGESDVTAAKAAADRYAKTFPGPTAPPTVAPAPVVKPKTSGDTGAPISQTSDPGTPGGHPMSWSPDVIARTDAITFRKAIADFEARANGTSGVAQLRQMREMAEAARRAK
jgi:hypothetical protein